MIGLGGGSLLKYCYRRLPYVIIRVAEISAEVIALRRSFFIPDDDDRLTVYREDGAAFVRRHPAQFDVLLVDGFDNKGQPPQLCSQQFYHDCYRSLTEGGVLVVNVCDSRSSILLGRIRRSFHNQVIVNDGDTRTSNMIVFANKSTPFDDPSVPT
jgi:spermidine synthase